METTPYITKRGDTWALIAYKAYGDITKMKQVMDANPSIALVVIFEDGITIDLPIIPETETQTNDLPPWKM